MYKSKVNCLNHEYKEIVIVLGGTVPHKRVIEKLKERGYYTVLIDYFEKPAAADVADMHFQESAMDLEIVVDIARKTGASYIISPCLDQQLNIAMKAAEILGLRHAFSSEVAAMVTNKRLMKQKMLEGGIPTAKYYIVDTWSDLDSLDLTYPVIVKPVDSCGSAGVAKVDSKHDLVKTVKDSIKWSKDSRVIVEEFICGTELSVHGYIEDGKGKILFSSCKLTDTSVVPFQQVINMYMPKIRDDIQSELERIFNLILQTFCLPQNVTLFMQVIVQGGNVFVIEFSPRIGGGLSSYVSEKYAGFDLINYSIDTFIDYHTNRGASHLNRFVCNCPIYCKSGILSKIIGSEELVKEGVVADIQLLKPLGECVNTEKPSGANVLKYIIEGKTIEECFEKAVCAKERTECLNEKGESIIDRRCVLSKTKFDNYTKILF